MKAGFLQPTDALPPAVAAEALEQAASGAFAEAVRLRAVENPEEQPFQSRYEEREILQTLSRQAAANAQAESADSDAAKRASTIRALADNLLGRNYMDTEEASTGQPHLESAIDGLAGVPSEVVAYVDALNSLGVLWANRGEAKLSLELLERARVAHATASEDQLGADAMQHLEDALTLTTFYLAQAYGLLGERSKSAAHCHETMRRQLARRGANREGEFAFDSREWTRNACDLSKYYATVDRYDIAEHCLRAAEAVLRAARAQDAAARVAAAAAATSESAPADGAEAGAPSAAAAPAAGELTDRGVVYLDGTADDKAEAEAKLRAAAPPQSADPAEMTEDEAEAVAGVELAWIDLWIAVLKQAEMLRRQKSSKAGPEESTEATEEGIALGPLAKLAFGELSLPPPSAVCLTPAKISSFEAARDIFKRGSAHAARAKATFVLDGFVTMHFEVLERESSLYSALSEWEMDLPRRHAMQKRRIGLLKPAIEQLNEKAYTQLVRQTLFDISTIAAEMLEIKGAMAYGDPLPRRIKKLEKEVEHVVECCAGFTSRFDETPLPAGEVGDLPNKVDEEQERAYLQCRFYLARAHGKIETPASLGAQLREYERIGQYLTRNPVAGMEQEAKVCAEMAELLPHKIAVAKRGMS